MFARLLLVSFLLAPLSAHALRYEVIGACSPVPVYAGDFAVTGSELSAGAASIAIFTRDQIPFLGTEAGLNSILNTPVGQDAMEIISDTEMRVYGWCYEVDGVEPNVMPDEYSVIGKSLLKWTYTFSEYKAGEWVSYCRPAHEIRPAALCH